LHYLTEYISISKRRSFREKHFIFIVFDGIFPKFTSRVNSIKLESESPSLGVFIVSLKNIAACCIFPLIYWLFDCVGVEKFKKSTFSGS